MTKASRSFAVLFAAFISALMLVPTLNVPPAAATNPETANLA